MEVVIGTYEEFLVGYKLIKKKGQFNLEQSFTNHAHCGSVRSVAHSSKYLVSGSIDEVIHIISMKHRIDSGTLVAHSGTITALEFLRSAYLFSASEDGNICIWNTRRWDCEKVLRGHKEAVNSLSIHSSGKVLLSVSKDKTLRTWNLIKGRCAYIVNLKDISHQVLWSPSCIYFAVVFDDHVDIYDIGTGGVLHSIEKSDFDKRINKVLFIDDNNLILCGDCNELVIYDLSAKCVISRLNAHENRIKDMTWVSLKSVDPELVDQETIDDNDKWLVTTSSDGFIKIWSFDFSNLANEPTLVTQVNSTCRPTCLTVWTSNQNPNGRFDKFSIPELKISKEELEVCKSKINEKKANKRKLAEMNEDEPTEPTEIAPVISAKLEAKKTKKLKAKAAKKKALLPQEPAPLPPPAQPVSEEDEDDEEAIRNMKATSDTFKQMTKYKKGNKRNVTTFKMRQAQKRANKNENGISMGKGFKVSDKDSKRNSTDRSRRSDGAYKQKKQEFQQRNNKKPGNNYNKNNNSNFGLLKSRKGPSRL